MIPIKKFNSLLNPKQKRSVLFLLFLILIGMFLETLGIGLVIPVFTIITDPNIGDKYPELVAFFSKLSPLNLLFKNTETISAQAMLITGSIIAIIFVYFVKACYLIFLSWKQNTFVTKLSIGWSDKLFSGYLNLPYSFHLQKNSAYLIRNVNQANVVAMALELSLTLITEIMVAIGIATLLIITEPTGALIVVLTFLISGYYFQRFTKKHLLNWGQKRQLYEGHRIKYMQQGFGGAKDLKLMGREENFSNKFLKFNTGSAFVARNTRVLKSLPRLWLEVMVVICLSLLLFSMLLSNQSVNELIPTLGLFAAASFRLMPSANKILSSIQQLRYEGPQIENVCKELKENRFFNHSKNSNEKFLFQNDIKLEEINYTYQGSSKPTLQNININIPSGFQTGFIGESGSGKSTLIDIILGLLDPTSGKVKVDDINIRKNLRGWQSKIGYVPQTIFLTDDTLRNNVAFAIPENKISDQLVKEAIKSANLEEYVNSLPDGLNTIVGERGVRLSGGQRQRIGIARALYHKPKVLVLDEATSALDINTEKEIMNGINKLRKKITVLIISHRENTVSACDQLFKLKNGRIVGDSTSKEISNITK